MTNQAIDSSHLAGLVIQALSHKSDSDLLDMLTDSNDIRDLITGHPPDELDICMRDLHSLWKLSPATNRPALPVNGKRNEG